MLCREFHANRMHAQLWLVEDMPKKGDFEPLRASGQSMPESSRYSNAAQSRVLLDEPLVVGETRPTTLLFADPPTALAVTAEGASCVARAVPSDSVSCMLAARRVPTDRFADGGH